MSGDIKSLAEALRGGDLTAAPPLLDALREAGDATRADKLHAAVGDLLARRPGGRILYRSAAQFAEDVDALFWPELCRDGLQGLAGEYAAFLARHRAFSESRESTQLVDEEGLPLTPAGYGASRQGDAP